MASRHLRRLQKSTDLALAEDTSEDEESSPAKQPKHNPFSYLEEEEKEGTEEGRNGELSSSGQDDELEGDYKAQGKTSASGFDTFKSQSHASLPEGRQKESGDPHSSKASKKRTAKKAKQGSKKAEASGEEDLDKLLESLDIKIVPQPKQEEGTSVQPYSVLKLNVKRLKPEDELRRIFGSKFISSEGRDPNEGQGNFAHATRKVRRLAARGLIKRVQLTPGLIIQPRDDWPPLEGSLEMISDSSDPNKEAYCYVPTPRHQIVQQLFEQAQASYDPNQLIQLLGRYPYHVEALIAASELYRSTGQHETADEMLARGLYALEMAWPSGFVPGVSTLSINNKFPENMLLFRTLFKYIQTLVRRGLYATALENGKLLMTLNEEDPTGITLCIDYIALRAGQYSFIQELQAEKDQQGNSLSSLPNWAFSTGLANALQDPSSTDDKAGVDAVLQFPSIVVSLMERLEEKGVHADSEFKQILGHRLFKTADEHGNASLTHLVSIYVERQHTLYKEAKVLKWLKRCCQKAVAPAEKLQLEDWEAMRSQLWPPCKTDNYADLRLADFSDEVAALPPGEMPGMAEQPPRGREANIDALHEHIREELPEEAREQLLEMMIGDTDIENMSTRLRNGEELSQEEMQRMNPILAFVETFLPWINIAPDPNRQNGQQ